MKEHNERLEVASFFGGCFGRMMLENLLWRSWYRSWLRIQLRDLVKLLIYMKIPAEFNSNDTFAQPKLKININLELLIMTSTSISNTFSSFHHIFLEKVVQKSNPRTIPTNQPTNRDQQENPLPANLSRDHHDPPTDIHPSVPDEAGGSSARCSWDSKDGKRGGWPSCREGGCFCNGYTPGKLTWNLKMSPWKRRFVLKTIIFRFHVSFRGVGLIWPY